MTDGISSFWGPVTSTIECCEKNYAYSSYIAEFHNTISNVPDILLALIGLVNALRQRFEKRLQRSDETPMVWEMLLYMYILYSPDWHYRSTMPTFLFLYGAAFAVVHAFLRFWDWFQGALRGALPSVHPLDVQVLHSHVGRCCQEDREMGHALWHVFMGFNSYFANTFLMFCRAQQRGWSPKVKYFLGVLPYVKIEKPKTQ
ncbi:hypothetical protein F2Q69_00009341 [Brassica cretica]|uniref:Uncharacterized protein n=1 Tax=Brassica cretica TaxID=69181 RepID=A0A8S9P5Y0_BRACR|nr:hypothetical protein F2Q69_00009341 [Brassica cretica]